MKNLAVLMLGSLLGISQLAAAPVTADVLFTGGALGDFSISYTAGDPAVQLDKLTINLGPGLYFDPTLVAPGALLPLPFSNVSGGAATGFVGQSGDVDGGTVLMLDFNDFDSGETFSFSLDVDQTIDTSACNAIPNAIARAICVAAVIAANQLPASIVLGPEFNATASASFDGAGVTPTTLGPAPFVDQSDVLNIQSLATITGDVQVVPEPSTLVFMGAGLGLIALYRRRQA